MSRTYHHGRKSPKKRINWDETNPTKKKRKYIHPWSFWCHTPSWWTRQMMTRPQRQEVRRLIKQLHRLPDIADAPLFPLAKRPYQYFW